MLSVSHMLVSQPTNITRCQASRWAGDRREREQAGPCLSGIYSEEQTLFNKHSIRVSCCKETYKVRRGGPHVTSLHRGSSLERLISIIYRGIYGSNRLSDSTKVTAGKRQKIWLEK